MKVLIVGIGALGGTICGPCNQCRSARSAGDSQLPIRRPVF